MFNLLPLVKGWEYKTHSVSRTVIRGASPLDALRVEEMGWLMQISELTSDAYGTVMIDWQGADLQTFSGIMTPQGYYSVGAFAQDPSGWVQKYFRPNPNSQLQ